MEPTDERSTGLSAFLLRLLSWIPLLGSSSQTGDGVSGQSIEWPELDKPVALSINYSDAEIRHLDESRLSIYHSGDGGQAWASLPTQVDQANNIASAQTTQLGEFDLRGPLACPADSAEPFNDEQYQAESLASGVSVANLFDIADDEDWFALDASQGITYTLTTSNLGAGVDTVLELYDTDGVTLLASNDNDGGAPSSRLEWLAPAGGLYYVHVVPKPGSAIGCTASYELKMVSSSRSVYLPLILK
jgi:hypothetical protein